MDKVEHSRLAIQKVIKAYRNVAIWSSGGKDSLTLSHLAKDYADRITILHVTMGKDGFDGDLQNLLKVSHGMGYSNVIVIPTPMSLTEYSERFGWPSQLIPANQDGSFRNPWTPESNLVASHTHCTMWRFIVPLVEESAKRGFDCIMTGSRSSDADAFDRMGEMVNSAGVSGWDRCNPLMAWTEHEVYAYIDEHQIELPPVYKIKRTAGIDVPDCRLCPWNTEYIKWMKAHNPTDFAELQRLAGPAMRDVSRRAKELLQGIDLIAGEV